MEVYYCPSANDVGRYPKNSADRADSGGFHCPSKQRFFLQSSLTTPLNAKYNLAKDGQVRSLVEAASWTKGLKSIPYAPGKLRVKEGDYVLGTQSP